MSCRRSISRCGTRKSTGISIAAFNIDITNGGAGALQNMHLHAGLQNGGYCEWHLPWMTLDKIIYKNMPEPVAEASE